ncbi:MAG: DUF3794 domain-containing protein [Clostridiales bacterium]|nr:DUF3794 domain-containing protein [Clostridiales bacterium]
MEFNLCTRELNTPQTVFEGRTEQAVDSDISLPDYCPDVTRILKCDIVPAVTGTQVVGGRLTFEGIAAVRMIYVSDDNKVHCYEQEYPFSKYIESDEISDSSAVCIKAKTDYVNCRAVSQRRTDTHGMMTFIVKAYEKKGEEMIESAEGAGIQLKCEEIKCADFVSVSSKTFTMDEVIETDNKPPVLNIVRATAFALADDVKAISNKLLVKGELGVTVLYSADDGDSSLVRIEHTMPISQIIEAEGITDKSENSVSLNVSALKVTPKTDSDGKPTLLDISAFICAGITAYDTEELTFVTDAYSTCCEISAEYKRTEFLSPELRINDRNVVSDNLDLNGSGVNEVTDIWCTDVTSNVSLKGSDLVIGGSMTANILFTDGENKPGFAQKQLDYEYRRPMGEPVSNIKCDPDITVTGCTASVNSDKRIDVRAEMLINAVVFSSSNKKVLTGIEPDMSRSKCGQRSAVTIYFPESGEAVWDIARRYNTTTEAIMQENDLIGDEIPESRMLIIPGV